MLTEEQAESIKKRLIEQISKSFPEDKKDFAISQIQGMDSEQLEAFLIKNNLVKSGGQSGSSAQCVFCSIVSGDISSHKIAENAKAIAVLEINPLSRGHVIIIPKEHITSEEEIPEKIRELSEKVSALLKKRLKAAEIDLSYSNVMGHEIINLVPVYDGKKPAEKRPASEEELQELQKLLIKKVFLEEKPAEKDYEKKEKQKITKKISEKIEKIWLPKRIP